MYVLYHNRTPVACSKYPRVLNRISDLRREKEPTELFYVKRVSSEEAGKADRFPGPIMFLDHFDADHKFIARTCKSCAHRVNNSALKRYHSRLSCIRMKYEGFPFKCDLCGWVFKEKYHG